MWKPSDAFKDLFTKTTTRRLGPLWHLVQFSVSMVPCALIVALAEHTRRDPIFQEEFIKNLKINSEGGPKDFEVELRLFI